MLTGRLLTFLSFVFGVLPHRVALSLGAALGLVLWAFSKKRVDHAESRCVAALGLGVTRARAVVRASYMNMGRSGVEFARLNKMRPLSSFVSIIGKERLDEALSRGHGVIVMSAHFGNWELAGAALVAAGYALSPIYTKQRNKGGVNDWIEQRRLDDTGMTTISSEGAAMREIFRSLRGRKILVFLQDLDARREGKILPFLGLPASCATGIIRLYKKFASPVLPVVCLRHPDGIHHTVCVNKILSDFSDEDGNSFGINMEKSLKMCNNVLGSWIIDNPGQWMWILDKWGFALKNLVDAAS
ncbi:lipid A biosynthesis acyltransferase [Synergistales bacterium]|nr:lipid A biosynthesis acyltransferase [Synergistales bacterium]